MAIPNSYGPTTYLEQQRRQKQEDLMKPISYIAAVKLPLSDEPFMFVFKSENDRSQFIAGVKFMDPKMEAITSETFKLED